MDDERRSWLRENWKTGLILALIVGLAAFLRVYFVYHMFAPAGFWTGGGDYSGGSDPFYWERALLYSFQTGKELSWDYAMNYPIGFPDVRPPLFDWFNLLAGYLAAPAFGSTWDAMVWMLNMNAAIFGVLSLIPTYLIGKEAFNRRAGLLAALLLAISAASLQRSHATIAVHDSWTLFFVICTFYFYLRALKTLNRRRWVESWFSRKSVVAGLRQFLQENRKSVLYALLAGMSVAVTALSWQGWAYVPVILILVFVIEIILDRIRNQDVMGVTILFLIILATPLVVSFPWYQVRNLIRVWWDVPLYLFLVAAALGIVFTVTRDYPWTLVLPATFGAAAVGILAISSANPNLLLSIVSGAGYFIKTKVYSTIAEAQEPGMSELVLNFGWFTFYVGLGAVAYMIWQIPRRNNAAFTMLVLWTVGALFMALSAARFIFNAAPAMALATGYALDLVLARFGFAEMRRTYRSLSEGNWRNALRKSVKPRHVIIAVLLAFLVLLPNAWFAVDAAIPYEQKGAFDRQLQSTLPAFLQAPGYSSASGGGTFYFGAFGYSLPVATQYFPAAYQWLSTQDTNVPLEQRPAVMAWWDYGFEIAERGQHPVPADPFQNGYAIAGQFILAQNESSAITLMTLRLIEGDWRSHGYAVSPGMARLLSAYGINPDQVNFAFKNTFALIPIILNNPTTYGLWASNLQFVNAPYIYLDQVFLSRLTEDRIVGLYHDVRAYTGWSIGYFMLDTRLFPVSATNTGIFYAPAELSDHRTLRLVNGQVLPYDFFQLFATTNQGSNLPLQNVPPTAQVQSTSIKYQPMFYNSMFYRAYIGYAPKDLGSTDTGIPGMDQALAQYIPNPAWNLTHFRVVYRTAYYNPYPDPANHTSAWKAMNYDQAAAKQKLIQAGKAKGVVDMSTLTDISNGAIILAYVDGAVVNGTVSVGGVPLAGVHITVTDELGTPHMLTTTDAAGHYSAIVPFGNITITASVGALDKQTLLGATTLTSTTFPVTTAQANRANEDPDGDGIPDWLVTKDLAVPAQSLTGTLYFDLNHDSSFDAGDRVAAGARLRLTQPDINYTVSVTADATGAFSATNLVGNTYRAQVVYQGHTVPLPNVQTASPLGPSQNLAVPFAVVRGSTVGTGGRPIGDANVTLLDQTNGTSWRTTADGQGAYAFQPTLPGGYVLSAAAGDLASGPTYLSIGATASIQNLTLQPSGAAQGTTDLFGMPFAHATLSFQDVGLTDVISTVTSDAQGHFRIDLPAGDWNVYGRAYSGGLLYATLGRLTIQPGATTAYDANFVDGARVSGSVSSSNQHGELGARIGFIGSGGEVWLHSGLGNTYLVYLPLGTYSVVASAQSSVLTESVTVGSTQTLDFALQNATSISGLVYWDKNGNGVADSGEGVGGARIRLTDAQGRLDAAVADGSGAFTIGLLPDVTYAGQVSANGFYPRAINATTAAGIGPNVHWTLSPIPVALGGTVSLNGTVLLNRPVTVRALALGGGAVTQIVASQTDGSFSLSLTPGDYRLVVDENATAGSAAWRYQNLRLDILNLTVGEGQVLHDLTLAARALVKGNVTLNGVGTPATVSFQGPDTAQLPANATGGFQTYLQAGTYVIGATRTASGTPYGVVKSMSLPTTGSVGLALGLAAKVTGTALFAGASVTTPLTVTFQRAGGGSFRAATGADGTYTLALVPGNYTVAVANVTSASSGGATHYYRYTFQGSLSIPPGTATLAYDLGLARALDNTTVAGVVAWSGAGVDATLTFDALSGGAMTLATAAALNGSYVASLAPGTYTVYATRASGSTAFLGALTVPHASAFSYPITLRPAFQLSGVTMDPNSVRVAATLTLEAVARLTLATDPTGAYGVLLPAGSYALTGQRNQTEQGVLVKYQGTASFDLSTDTVVNLQLGRVDQRSVALTWDAAQNRTVRPGASVTYTIHVQNAGNVQDTFLLSGGTPGWTFSFAPPSVTLDYGTAPNAAYVLVTIQSPPDALVQHGPVTITATSATDPTAHSSLSVQVGISRVRGLTLQVDPLSGIFDGRYLNYTATVRNTGNEAEAVDVSIQNPGDIAASGWVAALSKVASPGTSGLVLTNVSVPANATASVRLSLRLSGAHGAATVALQAAAVDNAAVSGQTVFTASLPQLSMPAGIGVSGPGIATSLPPNEILLAAVIGAVAAAAVGLLLTRRRR